MRTRVLLPAFSLLIAVLAGCGAVSVVDTLDGASPSPDLGRPMWVRVPARIGVVMGGTVGGVLSIIALPITAPIALLTEDKLGESNLELMVAPFAVGASGGHFVVGGPFDVLDFTFRRAWIDEPTATEYEFEELTPPLGPVSTQARGDARIETIDAPESAEPIEPPTDRAAETPGP